MLRIKKKLLRNKVKLLRIKKKLLFMYSYKYNSLGTIKCDVKNCARTVDTELCKENSFTLIEKIMTVTFNTLKCTSSVEVFPLWTSFQDIFKIFFLMHIKIRFWLLYIYSIFA